MLLIAVGFTSCITIEEIYTFRSDGSGNMKYVIDMSETADLMNSFKSDEDDEESAGNEDLDEAVESLKETAEKLKSISGITKIENTADNEKLIYTLSFDFKDIDALNKALNEVIKDSSSAEFHEFFTMKGKNLVRNSKMGDQMKGIAGEEDEEMDETAKEMANMMLESMKYNITFNFENGVKSVKTKSTIGELAEDKKTYTMKANFKQLSEGKNLMDASFKLR